MGFDETAALLFGIAFTLVYAFMLFKNALPFIKQFHQVSLLKERSDLTAANAEIVDIKERGLIGTKRDFCVLYIMRVKFQTEKAERGFESAEIIFAEKPTERAGQNIGVLYSPDEPSKIMTSVGREKSGAAAIFAKLAVSVIIAFAIIFAVFYRFCKFGLPDD